MADLATVWAPGAVYPSDVEGMNLDSQSQLEGAPVFFRLTQSLDALAPHSQSPWNGHQLRGRG